LNNILPLVSLLIPAYNSAKWIRSTIQSALAQTWSNKEIIVVDDGSSDNTLQIAKQFESEIVKVATQKNKGASAARNHALSLAKGDFIQWLDADDILAPDKIEIQLLNSDKYPDSKILHSSSWGMFYYRLKSVKSNPNQLWKDLSPIDWLILNLQGDGHFMTNCAWLVSRKLTELAGPWDERLTYNDDGEYFCRVVSMSEFVKFHSQAKSYYRKGNLSSISRSLSFSNRAFNSLSLSINLCIDYLINLDDGELARNACIKALNKVNSLSNESFSEVVDQNKKRIFQMGGEIKNDYKSTRYQLSTIVFGTKKANLLKNIIWHTRIILRKYLEKFQAEIFGDRI